MDSNQIAEQNSRTIHDGFSQNCRAIHHGFSQNSWAILHGFSQNRWAIQWILKEQQDYIMQSHRIVWHFNEFNRITELYTACRVGQNLNQAERTCVIHFIICGDLKTVNNFFLNLHFQSNLRNKCLYFKIPRSSFPDVILV